MVKGKQRKLDKTSGIFIRKFGDGREQISSTKNLAREVIHVSPSMPANEDLFNIQKHNNPKKIFRITAHKGTLYYTAH